jgi:hypothetical protein
VLGAGEITALLAVWGGELLLIVVRQVLGSDITNEGKQEKEENPARVGFRLDAPDGEEGKNE